MRLLGVDRLDFGRVAYWRDDYATQSLGSLLNRLGSQSEGLLVTPRFLERTALAVGDRVTLDVISADLAQAQEAVVRIPFTVVGTFDYFPTLYEEKQGLAVANLECLYEALGSVEPHNVWLRTRPDTEPEALRAGLHALGVAPMQIQDSRATIREDREKLERVGIFGNLSVSFLAGTLVAWLGLLVHTFASLTGRIHEFAITRAIGLRLRQVLTIVSLEYLSVMFYGVLGGAGAGLAASRLFVRYFQFTEDPSIQVPPFRPEIASAQIAWILLAYLAVLLLAEGIVLLRATRREVFQALRIGDEE
jgi:putative ABC transport system permease protein